MEPSPEPEPPSTKHKGRHTATYGSARRTPRHAQEALIDEDGNPITAEDANHVSKTLTRGRKLDFTIKGFKAPSGVAKSQAVAETDGGHEEEDTGADEPKGKKRRKAGGKAAQAVNTSTTTPSISKTSKGDKAASSRHTAPTRSSRKAVEEATTSSRKATRTNGKTAHELKHQEYEFSDMDE